MSRPRTPRQTYTPAPPSAAEIREKAIASARTTLQLTNRSDMDFYTGYMGLERTRDQLKTKLAKWAEEFAKDPADALGWSVDTFGAAAQLKVIAEILYHHDRGVSDQNILATLQVDARRVPALSRSTSPTSNLMEDATRIAYAKYAESLESHLRHIERAASLIAGVEAGIA
jgi:hypothetical protein